MAGTLIPPCGKECPDRQPGCQGKCAKMEEFHAQLAALKADDERKRILDDYVKETSAHIRRICHTPRR